MKKKKYLPIYYKWMKRQRMEECSGLCDLFDYGDYDEFDLLKPTDSDIDRLIADGYSSFCWGSGQKQDMFFVFTPLRQNIVLLMAAMNNEL